MAVWGHWTRALALACCLALPACKREAHVDPPARATDSFDPPSENSIIAVPIDADVSLLHALLEREVPRELWQIDRHFDSCVPPQRVKVFGTRVPVTPKLGCRVVGQVTRGPIRLRGAGRELVADMPIRARISARDVGGILKGETATGSAMVRAHLTIEMRRDWSARARVRISHDWAREPGIDFLGKRITFTDQADEKLRPVIARLERELPRELARLDLRRKIDGAWRQAFTVLSLNGSNPPVWMRVTPRQLSYGGYRLDGGKLQFQLGMEALTETFVGTRPPDPEPAPLPDMATLAEAGHLRFFIPVIADYAELEPVILRALTKRAQRPFEVPRLGPVVARFEKATFYGIAGGRVAVGLDVAVKPRDLKIKETRGTIWLTALPVNQPGTRTVAFRDLKVDGATDHVAGDLLIRLAQGPEITETIAASLTQDFERDYQKLLGKVQTAIDDERQGDFTIRTEIGEVETGSLKAAGRGLYLPVRVSGSARIAYRPGRR